MGERKSFCLSDDVLRHIVQLVQLGILTGTDVVDHMRLIKLEEATDGVLDLTPEYVEYSKESIQKLLAFAREQLNNKDV